MNNCALDQKRFAGRGKATGTTTNVQRESHTSIPKGSILEKLMEFAYVVLRPLPSING